MRIDDPPPEELYKLVDYYKQSQFEWVYSNAKKLLKKYNNSLALWRLIGASAAKLDNFDEALAAYQKVLLIKPDDAEAYLNIGNAYKNKGKLGDAILAFRKAVSTRPGYAEAYNNMANILQSQGELDKAIEAYTYALAAKPHNAVTHHNMGNAFIKLGRLDEAILSFETAISIKPGYASAQHMLATLTGTATEKAPSEYVAKLFDKYAQDFEPLLVGKLKYRTPKLIKELLIKLEHGKSLGSVLDLGCGTGLLGAEIKSHCSRLEGIDLSGKMLALAKEKQVYDSLNQAELVGYLTKSHLNFDYFIASDVFVYLGKLDEVLHMIVSRNKRSGKLVFSTEHSQKPGYNLLETGRYSHSKCYVESLCKKFNFNTCHFSTHKLRKENGDFITGGIYVLSF